jgi:hypothetical protein
MMFTIEPFLAQGALIGTLADRLVANFFGVFFYGTHRSSHAGRSSFSDRLKHSSMPAAGRRDDRAAAASSSSYTQECTTTKSTGRLQSRRRDSPT